MSSTTQFTNTIVPVNALIPVTVEGSLQVEGTISGSLKSNVADVVLDGTGSETTAVLSYGVNVISSSDASNFCARLPLASKGQTVTVINPSSTEARILPSQTGGSVNGLENGFFNVPNNSLAYNFICYDNPAPGGWSTVQTPLGGTVISAEFEIPHVNGSSSFYVGNSVVVKSSYGGGVGGDNYEIFALIPTASGTWDTLPSKAVATKVRVYTNVSASDAAAVTIDPNENRFDAFLGGFYKNIPNGSIQGQRSQFTIYSDAPTPENPFSFDPNLKVVGPSGVISNPLQIGDLGTLYGESVPFGGYGNIDGFPVGGLPIGLGGEYGPYYYIFCVDIGEEYATKTYKVRFELEYIVL